METFTSVNNFMFVITAQLSGFMMFGMLDVITLFSSSCSPSISGTHCGPVDEDPLPTFSLSLLLSPDTLHLLVNTYKQQHE